MAHEHGLEVTADEVGQAIDFTATTISQRFSLDVVRVRAVLERTDYEGKRNDSASQSTKLMPRLWRRAWQQTHPSEWRDLHLHTFSPSLAHALEHLPPAKALNLFENENNSLLKSRESAMHYLFESFTPLYDLKELRKLTKSLRSHLKRNRNYILETGLPKSTFKKSQLLNGLLSPLYPGKNSCSISSDESKVSLDESHNLNTYDRSTIFDLKLKILGKIITALKNKNTHMLLEEFADEMTCMRSKDFHRFIELEKLNCSRSTSSKIEYTCNFYLTTGGIIDILKTIGYYEKELSIGTYSKTKNMLADIISTRNFTRLRKDNNTDVSPYFICVALGKKGALDTVLDKFLSLQTEEENFWKHYSRRVQESLEGIIASFVRSDFYDAVYESGTSVRFKVEIDRESDSFKKVVFETMVETGFADLLEQNLHYFAELFKWHIANTGQPPEPPALNLIATTPISENGFRKDGEIWKITFQGKSISSKDTKGLRYIAFLISHPRKEYHVLDLVSEVDGTPAEFVDRGGKKGTVKELTDEKSAGDHDHRIPSDENVDVIFDAQAQEKIKEELDWLERELEEAVQNNDLERASHIRAQKDNILEHLGKASGLFDRSRKFSDDGEKARKRVAAAIRRTVEAIEKENTDLWRHLKSCIKTGYSCSYEPLEDIEWSF